MSYHRASSFNLLCCHGSHSRLTKMGIRATNPPYLMSGSLQHHRHWNPERLPMPWLFPGPWPQCQHRPLWNWLQWAQPAPVCWIYLCELSSVSFLHMSFVYLHLSLANYLISVLCNSSPMFTFMFIYTSQLCCWSWDMSSCILPYSLLILH